MCLFIGEANGAREDKDKRVFVGPTGQEVNDNYLPLGGYHRPDVRIMNAISCLPPGPKGKLDPKRRADLELLDSCSKHFLIPEIKRNSYSLLVPMGQFACKAIGLDINLEIKHGFPIESPYGLSFPMFHPAGGLHEPKKMLQIRTDWIRLRKFSRNKLYLPVDEFKGAEDYRFIDSVEMLDMVLENMWASPLACDTEITRKRVPFCLTFSVFPGSGWLIMADRLDLLQRFQDHLDNWTGKILFHNWLFDEAVVKAMGLRFPRKKIVDTMVRAFHLGNVPQGLKALSWRELGMDMQDFYDLVSPYSKTLVTSYFLQASWHKWPKPEAESYRDPSGKWKIKNPQTLNTKIKRFFTDLDKDPDKDVFIMWDKNWISHQQMIEETCGEYPGLCITHAPMDEVLYYACRDADATLRWYHRLLHMEKRVRVTTQENWGDV